MAIYTRRIIAVRGDTHAGHDGGLLSPDTEFPDIEYTDDGRREITGYSGAQLNKRQARFWKWAEEDKENTLALADGAPIDFIDMGDVTQGIKFTDNLKETNLGQQVFAAIANARQWAGLKQVVSYTAVKGTGVHVFGDGSAETLLTHYLKKDYPKKNITVSSHYMLDFDGFRVDVAHHGPASGARVWTESNSFDLYLKSLLWYDLDRDIAPAHLVLRGHTHNFLYGDAHKQIDDKLWFIQGVVTPPYCDIGDHAIKSQKSPSRAGVGTVVFEIINGRLHEIHPFLHYFDLRDERKL